MQGLCLHKEAILCRDTSITQSEGASLPPTFLSLLTPNTCQLTNIHFSYWTAPVPLNINVSKTISHFMLPCTDKNGSAAKAIQPEFRSTYQVLKNMPYSQSLMGEQCTGSKQTFKQAEWQFSSLGSKLNTRFHQHYTSSLNNYDIYKTNFVSCLENMQHLSTSQH